MLPGDGPVEAGCFVLGRSDAGGFDRGGSDEVGFDLPLFEVVGRLEFAEVGGRGGEVGFRSWEKGLQVKPCAGPVGQRFGCMPIRGPAWRIYSTDGVVGAPMRVVGFGGAYQGRLKVLT